MLRIVSFVNLFIILLVIMNTYSLNFPMTGPFNTNLIKMISLVSKRIGQFWGWKESCSAKWIETNHHELKRKLQDELVGQQLAVDMISEIFGKYWEKYLGSNYLLLCFYGGPGTGKTYTTKLLNNYMFKQKDKSYYYLFYSGAESYLSKDKLQELAEEMKESIQDAIEECPVTVVVFDEVQSYPAGFLDNVVLPFIKSDTTKNTLRGATFIFLTNIGQKELLGKSIEIDQSFFKSHTLYYYEPIVNNLMAESQDSFYSSELVRKKHVQHFVPFLHHKKESFIQCLERALSKNQFSRYDDSTKSSIIKNILEEVTYEPSSNSLYILSGCKRINSLILRESQRVSLRHREL